jgi:threonine dehydratase
VWRFFSGTLQNTAPPTTAATATKEEPPAKAATPPPAAAPTSAASKSEPYPPLRNKDELPVTFADISRANVAIRSGVRRTTCEKSYFLSELVGANIFLKHEFRQFTGSFKERGARNAILQLMREKGSSLKGVIAASAGNHALALAYHGKELGVPVTVVMPTVAPLAKVDKCRVSSLELEETGLVVSIPTYPFVICRFRDLVLASLSKVLTLARPRLLLKRL